MRRFSKYAALAAALCISGIAAGALVQSLTNVITEGTTYGPPAANDAGISLSFVPAAVSNTTPLGSTASVNQVLAQSPVTYVQLCVDNTGTLVDGGFDPIEPGGTLRAWRYNTQTGWGRAPTLDNAVTFAAGAGDGGTFTAGVGQAQASICFAEQQVNVTGPGDRLFFATDGIASLAGSTTFSVRLEGMLKPYKQNGN